MIIKADAEGHPLDVTADDLRLVQEGWIPAQTCQATLVVGESGERMIRYTEWVYENGRDVMRVRDLMV